MRGTLLALAIACGLVEMAAGRSTGAVERTPARHAPEFVMVDASSGDVIASRWDSLDRRLPLGSVIKPFTALAYADTHRLVYPTMTCHGASDRCWLPTGHGRIGITEAIAGSCNAYFRQLASDVPVESFTGTLRRFGLSPPADDLSRDDMVGYGDRVPLAPVSILRAYVELASRGSQPGVMPILQGMLASARHGTGRAVGVALAGADALVKTGTAPCAHSPRADADGYTVVVYPADRPRVALLVQAHGRTGAETAVFAAEILHDRLAVR